MPVAIDHQRRADRVQPAGGARNVAPSAQPGIEIAIHHQLDAVEPEWRQFEQSADCTAFQAFDWLAAWCRHIGPLTRTQPAIVVGRQATEQTLFILPLGGDAGRGPPPDVARQRSVRLQRPAARERDGVATDAGAISATCGGISAGSCSRIRAPATTSSS